MGDHSGTTQIPVSIVVELRCGSVWRHCCKNPLTKPILSDKRVHLQLHIPLFTPTVPLTFTATPHLRLSPHFHPQLHLHLHLHHPAPISQNSCLPLTFAFIPVRPFPSSPLSPPSSFYNTLVPVYRHGLPRIIPIITLAVCLV